MKTNKTEATARPWKLGGVSNRIVRDGYGTEIAVFSRKESFNLPDVIGGLNAALSVQAVNEYDALNMIAERLKSFCHVFENSDPDTSLGIQVTKGKVALSALAALRAKEPS